MKTSNEVQIHYTRDVAISNWQAETACYWLEVMSLIEC